jgi:hypothetical protein
MRDAHMLDLLFVFATIAFFVLALAYVRGLARKS